VLIVSSLGVFAGGGTPSTLHKVRSLADLLIDDHSDAPREVKL
jgi:hypothetical protein